MALWYCTGCSAAYAVGLEACPQCGATDHLEDPVPPGAWACHTPGCGGAWALQLLSCPRCKGTDIRQEEPMPRITVHGGPTVPSDPTTQPAAPPEGGEQPSPGTSSSTSDGTHAKSTPSTPTSRRRRAPTTANPSSPGRRPNPAPGGAGSTGGSTPATGSAPSSPPDSTK